MSDNVFISENDLSLSKTSAVLGEAVRMSEADINKWHQNLRANLAALTERYGHVLASAAANATRGLRIELLSDKGPIVRLKSDNCEVLLSDGGEEHVRVGLLNDVRQTLENGGALVFDGLGNGATLETVYYNQPKLYLGMLNPLYVLEQSIEVFTTNLLLHDWTELISSENVFFFIGPNSLELFTEFVEVNPAKPLPGRVVRSSTAGKQDLPAHIQWLCNLRSERLNQLIEKINNYYRRIPPDRFAELLSSNPPRRPRVHLITSIFSTVLQYSTRDIADAFTQLGWETQIDIESSYSDRPTILTTAERVWRFKPDLVFQIDHARSEWLHEILPEQLPFITWVQDRMAALYSSETAGKFKPTDIIFAISGGEDLVANYGYPADQMFHFPMVINSRTFSGRPEDDTDPHIAYASHASKTTEMLFEEAEEIVQNCPSEELQQSLIRAVRQLVPVAQDAFDRGEPLLFEFQWRALLRTTLNEHGIRFINNDHENILVNFLYMKMGNAMFRHEMLQWAVESGYPLRIFGSGWDEHPLFAAYAAGVAEHGEPLARLYRKSRINLQAVITCNVHQRVFEGVWAGGFFLLRHHPADFAPSIVAEIFDWLVDHRGSPVRELVTSGELTAEQRLGLQFLEGKWLGRFEILNDQALDLLARYAQYKGLVNFLGPMINDVYFSNRDEFIERANYFFDRPAERKKIVLAMQEQLNNWEMTKVLRDRLDKVSNYLAGQVVTA